MSIRSESESLTLLLLSTEDSLMLLSEAKVNSQQLYIFMMNNIAFPPINICDKCSSFPYFPSLESHLAGGQTKHVLYTLSWWSSPSVQLYLATFKVMQYMSRTLRPRAPFTGLIPCTFILAGICSYDESHHHPADPVGGTLHKGYSGHPLWMRPPFGVHNSIDVCFAVVISSGSLL